MIIPGFLKIGDTIGVTAPSYSAIEEEDGKRFENARKKLKDAGYETILTSDVFGFGIWDARAPADLRAKELKSLFDDDDVRIIVSAKGGDYEHEILDIFDWSCAEKNPKWMQGYSDNTSFLLKYTVEHDVATVYCGNFGDFGMDVWHRSIYEDLFFLEGRLKEQISFKHHEAGFHDRITQLEGFYDDEPTVWESSVGDVTLKGRLLGGCMDILAMFAGEDSLDVRSFYEKYPDDVIWYMETFDMNDESIRKMFSDMEKNGWFERVSGFVFGRELFYEGEGYRKVVTDCLSKYDVPLIFGADVGHKAPRMVFVNGVKAEFDIWDGTCTLTYTLD